MSRMAWGKTKTIRLLREKVWFPKLGKAVKNFIAECYACTVANSKMTPAPIKCRDLPKRPWKELTTDFKGPIGGPSGFYFHVVVDLYSRFPEVAMVKNTSFESLKPK